MGRESRFGREECTGSMAAGPPLPPRSANVSLTFEYGNAKKPQRGRDLRVIPEGQAQ